MNIEQVIAYRFPVVEERYSRRDAILYALGVGFATEPLDPSHLRFLFEDRLVASPTMANILGFPGLWIAEPQLAIDWRRVLHAEHRMILHSPLPSEARVIAKNRLTGLRDLSERGTMLHYQTDIADADTGQALASVVASVLARSDGGCGDWGDAPDALTKLPEASPDAVLDMETTEIQPLIYRLSGDRNPLHIDPAVSAAAGFRRPILHGLATKGMAGYALLRLFCDFDPARLRSMAVRFTRPVLPGDRLRFEFWGSAPGKIRFRAVLPEDGNAPVLDRCEAMIA